MRTILPVVPHLMEITVLLLCFFMGVANLATNRLKRSFTMNKFILATAAVALSASTAFAGMYGDTAETESDPFVPVETAAASSSAGGVGTALAVIAGVAIVAALANADSSSSSGSN